MLLLLLLCYLLPAAACCPLPPAACLVSPAFCRLPPSVCPHLLLPLLFVLLVMLMLLLLLLLVVVLATAAAIAAAAAADAAPVHVHARVLHAVMPMLLRLAANWPRRLLPPGVWCLPLLPATCPPLSVAAYRHCAGASTRLAPRRRTSWSFSRTALASVMYLSTCTTSTPRRRCASRMRTR